jgi:hypothetical protein
MPQRRLPPPCRCKQGNEEHELSTHTPLRQGVGTAYCHAPVGGNVVCTAFYMHDICCTTVGNAVCGA